MTALAFRNPFSGVIAGGCKRVGRFVANALDAIAEARMRRVRMEVALYRGEMTHSSKSDDDLPVVRWTGLTDDVRFNASRRGRP
jgi:hypothetical protein